MKKGARLPNKRGSCYCGSFQYELTAPFDAQLQCHCRECRYATGGAPNTVGLTKRENFFALACSRCLIGVLGYQQG